MKNVPTIFGHEEESMQISRELANTIVDPYAFAKWDPAHNAFSELRKNAPIAKAKPDDYDEFWIVSRYDDAQFVEKNLNKICQF